MNSLSSLHEEESLSHVKESMLKNKKNIVLDI